MTAVTIGVVAESAPDERRVAMVPEVVSRLTTTGATVIVEAGAGAAALMSDQAYRDAGAEVATADEVDRRSDVLLSVRALPATRRDRLRPGQTLIGLFSPLADPAFVTDCVRTKATAISLDLLPRTLSRAQTMDALSSQANIAGYRAALVAATAYGRYFPMLMTAAGTAKPAQVLVLGAGVAGLSAIGTTRRLGAMVSGYDIRPETRDEVRSMGARFLDLAAVQSGTGGGGYARALTAEERDAQQQALQERIAGFDVVITTAAVPGRRPPVLVTRAALDQMRPGSVVLDMAAGPLGGNVEGSAPDETLVVGDGVTLIGAGNLAASMPAGASTAYARNIAAMVAHVVHDGVLTIDLTDEILAAVVVSHAGGVFSPAVAAAHPDLSGTDSPQPDGGDA